MALSISLSPQRHLRLFSDASGFDVAVKPVAAARGIHDLLIERRESEALFELAVLSTADLDTLDSSFVFWRQLGSKYLRSRCREPAPEDGSLRAISALDDLSAYMLLASAPPMHGAEYLSEEILAEKWRELDEWLLAEVSRSYDGLSDFLKHRAPQWHVTGRVFFHLAENPNDPDYPFAFMATWQPEKKSARHQPLARALELFSGKAHKRQLIDLLQPIELAAKSSELLREMVDSGRVYQPQALQPHQAYEFLQQVPLMQSSGVIVRLPDWWARRKRPQIKGTVSTPSKSAIASSELLSFDVRAVLGADPLSDDELQQLLNSESGLVNLKGQWVEVDREKLTEALEQMTAISEQIDEDGLTFIEGMRMLAGVGSDMSVSAADPDSEPWQFIEPGDQLAALLEQLRDPQNSKSALPGKLPASLFKAQLRPYQATGVTWLWQLNQIGLGACLADDMGLGKTVQIIALLMLIKRQKSKKAGSPSLLVLPTSLLGNWQSELDKFAPSLNALFAHPSITDRSTISEWEQHGLPADTDLVLTTYGMLQRQQWLIDRQWHTVVLDEAQAIKNAGSKQSRATKQLKSGARIALTGTPIENRLSDLWSLFDFINPGLLGNITRFKKYIKELEKRQTAQYAPLRNLVQPYILRRLKTDKSVISDLPDKTEVRAWCGLSRAQARLYQRAVNELERALDSDEEGIKRRGQVLAFILRFKQICNHPAHYTANGEFKIKESGKFLRLAGICDEISARQEKLLVFTQFREMCQPLADFLEECFGVKGLVLHGGTSAKKRKELVAEFQADEGPPFFVLSIKAGGTGLNLTAASHVVHFDRWWNPAVENQATDRAYRIGQHRNVLVHKFICRGTIEERIDQVITDKASLAEELLSTGAETLLTEMSNEELMNLVSLDIEKSQVELLS